MQQEELETRTRELFSLRVSSARLGATKSHKVEKRV